MADVLKMRSARKVLRICRLHRLSVRGHLCAAVAQRGSFLRDPAHQTDPDLPEVADNFDLDYGPSTGRALPERIHMTTMPKFSPHSEGDTNPENRTFTTTAG